MGQMKHSGEGGAPARHAGLQLRGVIAREASARERWLGLG